MNEKEIDESMCNVFNYLNTIDLMPYIMKFTGEDIFSLMGELEEVFPYKDEYSETLFDMVGNYEFGDYLNNRYGFRIREESSIRIRL